MRRGFVFVAVFWVVTLIGFTGCKPGSGSDKPEFVFKFGHLANTDHVWHKSALKFAELVQALGVFGVIGFLFVWGLRTFKLLPTEARTLAS